MASWNRRNWSFCSLHDSLCGTPDECSTNSSGSVMPHDDMVDVFLAGYFEDILPNTGEPPELSHVEVHLDIVIDVVLCENVFCTTDVFMFCVWHMVGNMNNIQFGIISFGEVDTEFESAKTALRAIDWNKNVHASSTQTYLLTTSMGVVSNY
jgi:hypothetical protein